MNKSEKVCTIINGHFFENIQLSFKSELPQEDLDQLFFGLLFFVESFHTNDNCDLFSGFKNVLNLHHQNRKEIIREAAGRSKNNKIELTNEEEIKLAAYFEDTFKKIRPMIPKIIKLLKDKIKTESESDLNIIDLI